MRTGERGFARLYRNFFTFEFSSLCPLIYYISVKIYGLKDLKTLVIPLFTKSNIKFNNLFNFSAEKRSFIIEHLIDFGYMNCPLWVPESTTLKYNPIFRFPDGTKLGRGLGWTIVTRPNKIYANETSIIFMLAKPSARY